MNKQIPRQLRKKLAHSTMKVDMLERINQEYYLFLAFMEANGVNVNELSQKFVEARKAQSGGE